MRKKNVRACNSTLYPQVGKREEVEIIRDEIKVAKKENRFQGDFLRRM